MPSWWLEACPCMGKCSRQSWARTRATSEQGAEEVLQVVRARLERSSNHYGLSRRDIDAAMRRARAEIKYDPAGEPFDGGSGSSSAVVSSSSAVVSSSSTTIGGGSSHSNERGGTTLMRAAAAADDDMVNVRRGDLQAILDSLQRATQSVRHAARLADAARGSFDNEANTLSELTATVQRLARS